MDAPRAPFSPPTVLRLVAVPAIVSALVIAVRLYGELHGWEPRLFGTKQGGGSPIGITWLVPFFGAWFGLRLGRAGAGPASRWGALGWSGLGTALLVGGLVATWGLVIKHLPYSSYGVAAWAWLLTPLAWKAWPRLCLTNLVYGVLARLPIVAVTWVACQRNWDVHFAHVGSAHPSTAGWEDRAWWLSLAQIGLWIPFTILVGGVCGAVAALLSGRRR